MGVSFIYIEPTMYTVNLIFNSQQSHYQKI